MVIGVINIMVIMAMMTIAIMTNDRIINADIIV